MDPLSIATGSASLAVICVKVASSLYTFSDDIQNVETNVSGLYQELLGFSRSLEAIDKTWKQNPAVLKAYSGPDAALWVSVKENLDNSKITLQRLETRLESVKKGGIFGQGFLRKPAKAIKLNLSLPEMTMYRQWIHSHHVAMQGGLQMISLCLHLQETSSQRNLDQSLASLQDQIRRIDQRIAMAVRSTHDSHSISSKERIDRERMVMSLESLANAAKSFYSSTSSVVGARRSTIYDGSVLGEYTAGIDRTHNGVSDIHSSKVWEGSVIGQPLTEEQYNGIKEWIPPPSNIDEDGSDTTLVRTASRGSSAMNSRTRVSGNAVGQSATDSDSESYIQLELAKKTVDLALESVSNMNYPKAEIYLREAIQQFNRNERNSEDTVLTTIRLAFILVIQEKWNEVEDIVVTFTLDRVLYPLGVYHLFHAFAVYTFFHGDQSRALRYSMKALWGKRKHLGREHPSYQESVMLLSNMYQAAGQTTEAEACRAMITPDPSNQMAKFNEHLAQIYISSNTSQVFPTTSNALDSINVALQPSAQRFSVKSSVANDNDNVRRVGVKEKAGSSISKDFGQTPLYSAANNGQLEVVKLLLDRGADFRVSNKDGWTPLNAAACNGHLEVVKLLLEKGADFTVINSNGATPLYSAAHSGHLEVVKVLLERGADFTVPHKEGWTPLNIAANMGHLEVLVTLLERGADFSVPSNNGWTPLNAAAHSGHLEVVKLLLVRGADFTVLNSNGATPLYSAAHSGHLEVVKVLLERGADFTVPHKEGWTPLNIAADKGHLEVVKLLLEKGADFTVLNSNGAAPLYSAAHSGHLEVVKVLLERGADFSVPSNNGWTPLNIAADKGHLEVVKLLLEKGADFTVLNSNGATPLYSAAHSGHLEVVKVLLERGADFTVPHKEGWTPLNIAANMGHLEVVMTLLERGADFSVPNNSGWTPLNAAAHSGHLEVVKLLLEKGADFTAMNSSG